MADRRLRFVVNERRLRLFKFLAGICRNRGIDHRNGIASRRCGMFRNCRIQDRLQFDGRVPLRIADQLDADVDFLVRALGHTHDINALRSWPKLALAACSRLAISCRASFSRFQSNMDPARPGLPGGIAYLYLNDSTGVGTATLHLLGIKKERNNEAREKTQSEFE